MDIIKVSARSRSTAVAGAIGASAVNQAVKATAIARGYLQEDGIDIVCAPVFTDVDIHGLERTAVRLVVWTVAHSLLPSVLVEFDAKHNAEQGEMEPFSLLEM